MSLMSDRMKKEKKKNNKIILAGCLLAVLVLFGAAGYGILENENSAESEVMQKGNSEEFLSKETTQEELEECQSDEEYLENQTGIETENTASLSEESDLEERIEEYIQNMSLEEKAAQLFIITPESLVGIGTVTAAGDTTKKAFEEYPVGGLVYFEKNLISSDQVNSMLSNIQKYSMERMNLPAFTCLDEEGGTVTRISRTGKFDVPDIESMEIIGQNQNVEAAYEAGSQMGAYLSELGFNIDFAPVADVLSNPDNEVVKHRSFGSDPNLVSEMCLAVCQGLQEHQVCAVLKHFPGHGATEADSHKGNAYTLKSLEELQKCEWIPFQNGIDHHVPFIMVGHISLPNITGDDTPASLSEIMIYQILRNQMGYDGIVITDGMNMRAVTLRYSSGEAAVKALQAGVDLILMPTDFKGAYQGILDAVRQGILSEERIDESLRRILAVKMQLM